MHLRRLLATAIIGALLFSVTTVGSSANDTDTSTPVPIASLPLVASPMAGGSGTPEMNAAVSEACNAGQPVFHPSWYMLPAQPAGTLVYARTTGLSSDKSFYPIEVGVALVTVEGDDVVSCSTGLGEAQSGPIPPPASGMHAVGFALDPGPYPGEGTLFQMLVDTTTGVRPENHSRETARQVGPLPYTDSVDTSFADPQNYFVNRCDWGAGMTRLAWWRYTPTTTGPVTVTASGFPNASVRIARLEADGTVVEGGEECNESFGPDLEAGTTYLVGAGGPSISYYAQAVLQRAGRLTLTIAPAVDPPPPPPAEPPTIVTLRPVADSYANAAAPSANYGATSSLASRGTPGYESYLRFDLPAAPDGKVLADATLRITTTNLESAGTTQAHTVRLASDSWVENGITWRNRPALGSFAVGTLWSAPSPNTTYSIPLNTSAIRPLVGIRTTLAIDSGGNDNLWFWSGNYGQLSKRPTLVLTYE